MLSMSAKETFFPRHPWQRHWSGKHCLHDMHPSFHVNQCRALGRLPWCHALGPTAPCLMVCLPPTHSRADARRKLLLELRRRSVQRAGGLRQQGVFPVRCNEEAGEDGQGCTPLLDLPGLCRGFYMFCGFEHFVYRYQRGSLGGFWSTLSSTVISLANLCPY